MKYTLGRGRPFMHGCYIYIIEMYEEVNKKTFHTFLLETYNRFSDKYMFLDPAHRHWEEYPYLVDVEELETFDSRDDLINYLDRLVLLEELHK